QRGDRHPDASQIVRRPGSRDRLAVERSGAPQVPGRSGALPCQTALQSHCDGVWILARISQLFRGVIRMCGICGVVAFEGPLAPEIRKAMPAMTAAIRHRGPDGGAAKDFRDASLGHRRLAIIDRAGGKQPMANEDESVWIVFNGEIYNYRGLRRDPLTRGHRFRTNSE